MVSIDTAAAEKACGVLVAFNDAGADAYSGRPFSSRAMHKCLTEGAARFGWDKLTPVPRSMRDGRHLIGQGGGCDLHALALAGEGAGHSEQRRWRSSRPERTTSAQAPIP
jgi:CO/xanthine dehydrogenase Mo-binding subunit